MSPESFVEIFSDAMFLIVLIVSVVIIPGLLIGLLVAIFQAATSINEQTMSFLPRLVVTLVALAWGGHWIVQTLMDYTLQLVDSIPQMLG